MAWWSLLLSHRSWRLSLWQTAWMLLWALSETWSASFCCSFSICAHDDLNRACFKVSNWTSIGSCASVSFASLTFLRCDCCCCKSHGRGFAIERRRLQSQLNSWLSYDEQLLDELSFPEPRLGYGKPVWKKSALWHFKALACSSFSRSMGASYAKPLQGAASWGQILSWCLSRVLHW